MQILEYILANYTWFLVGIVLILLAIIGYYADKTNFGQDKSSKSNEDKKEIEQTENEIIADQNIASSSEGISEQTDTINNLTSTFENPNVEQQNIEYTKYSSNVDSNNEFADKVQNSTNTDTDMQNIESVLNELPSPKYKVKEEQEDILKINEEKFNMFSEEFESLMPKKNIINTDLLSDIDDLELDKTQKIDLSSVPDLDDIDLPKIMELTQENEDIWKF